MLNGFFVGIWWDDGTGQAVLAHSPTENATGDLLVDSNLKHVSEWPRVCKQFGKSAGDEYFSIPRGRVVYDRQHDRGIIYHGPATSPDRLQLIAEEFHLEDWISRLDEHYFTGADADRLFEED